MSISRVTRRRLLQSVAGTVAVAGAGGLWLGIDGLADRRFRRAVDRGEGFAPNVFLAIAADDAVTIWLSKSEMGQGVQTALPMIVADELDAAWSRVRVEQAVVDGRFDYGSTMTVASASVRSLWTELRRAGAIGRRMLLAAAARRWGVGVAECRTIAGRIMHDGSGRSCSYGEVAMAAAEERVPFRPTLKDPSQFRLIGTDVPRTGMAQRVDGSARYGTDVRIPGMRFCVIARPPMHRASVRAVDDGRARRVPGVLDVIELSAGVAVLATNTHAALRGRSLLDVTWVPGTSGGRDVGASLLEALEQPATARVRADERAESAPGVDSLEATYTVPFVAHATMEPMNCTARVSDGTCELWVPTQAPELARRRAAEVAGLPLDRVRVNTTLLGGGFGRRTATDFVAEAVEVSAACSEPVQVLWSREDDLAHGEYRGAAAHRISARIGADGVPIDWHHHVVSTTCNDIVPGRVEDAEVMGAVDTPYRLGAVRVSWTGVPSPLPLRIWRSVGYSHTVFAVESFVDELARRLGHDPVDYRLQLLGASPRLARCLERAAELADWRGRGSASRHLGVAVASAFGSDIAQIVELLPDRSGGLRVATVWCAVDCGTVVHPAGVRAQIEGGVTFGLSAALRERISLENGAVIQRNFDRYRVLRMVDAPHVEVDLLTSQADPGGVGELAVPPIAAAVANALHDATGIRLRQLPLDERRTA